MSPSPLNRRFRPIGRYRAILGESPVASADGQHVWWVDSDGQRLIRVLVETEVETVWDMPEAIGFVAEVWSRVIVGMQSGLFEFSPLTGHLEPIAGTSPGPGMRYNDACVDAFGGLWTGTMAMDGETPKGVLLHFPAPGMGIVIASGLRRINGLAHDPQTRTLVVSDSHPLSRAIWRIDLSASEPVLPAQPLTRLVGDEGRPDGAVIDGQSRYWVANIEGRALLEITRDGARGQRIDLPVSLPTKACSFGARQVCVTSKFSPGGELDGRLLLGEWPPGP
jgi:sugar lactone lactonase YvrE